MLIISIIILLVNIMIMTVSNSMMSAKIETLQKIVNSHNLELREIVQILEKIEHRTSVHDIVLNEQHKKSIQNAEKTIDGNAIVKFLNKR